LKKNCVSANVGAQKLVTLQAKKVMTMETDKELTLMKSRSSQACIRDGYKFYAAGFRQIFRYTWPLAAVFAILSATASALPVLVSPTLLLPGIGLALVSVVLLLYVASRQLQKRQLLQKAELKSAVWLHHLGMVLLVGVVCLFVVSVLAMLTCLPTVIMMAANWQSQMGILNGDPSGMPEYVKWLTIAVFLLAGFIQAYVWLTFIGPTYMLRGSIAQREKEKKDFNTKKNTKNEEKALVYRP